MDNQYTQHWDDKFKARVWGRYPPEDLIRFVARNFGSYAHHEVSVLEIGCGPGANLWFLHREGFHVAGIDCSPTAIEQATKRLTIENNDCNLIEPDLRVGDFSALPWPDEAFDLVIDIFALYANTLAVMESTLAEVERVLKPYGTFYSKLWGKNCTGYGEGLELEPGTFDDVPHGPCKQMGVCHFFDREEITRVFSRFEACAIDTVSRTDSYAQSTIEEYLCHFQKKSA
ncbi:MAG: class I SAM-dependent methyltransferase [Bdellovibrionales bacterium]|nr:class I SAM-dependent methyltransferase [Bdellovibrionales bacterium]